MSVKRSSTVTVGANTKAKSIKVISAEDISFNPSRNGSYTIRFSDENSKAGFKVLLKGGMFHRVPEGFIIYPKHKQLLKDEKVPFDLITE